MKKLTQMKLVNWHRFVNCTIEFGDTTLLSGENGAGKSTILDAIQFVVTCSANHFNKAAHENGKRRLSGYIRCKTGKENRPYERTGEVSAHIALEFYEESKKRYFILGAVVDSASEGQEVTARYLIDQARLSDEMFLQNNVPRNISGFRIYNKNIKAWAKTLAEARSMVTSRFGRIEDKLFRLIPKALAFRPIDDIKDFVYSYVLDEKQVNIDVLRENVRTYQDLERTLENVRQRIGKLERIEKFHGEVEEGRRKDIMYAYYLSHGEADLLGEQIRQGQGFVRDKGFKLDQERLLLDTIQKEKEEKQEMETALRVELNQNQDFIALNEQKKRLGELLGQKKELEKERLELGKMARKAQKMAAGLAEAGERETVKKYGHMLEEIIVNHFVDVAEGRSLTDEVIRWKKEWYGRLQQDLALLKNRLNEKVVQRQELDKVIGRLEKKQLSYAPAVICVRDAVTEEFARLGRKTMPRILCELLEITDDSWRNAVEGYLNTQRFYILVEPESFDIALGTYDRLRSQGKAYGVGLINAQKLEGYDTAPEGSLAAVVTSKNRDGKRFANMILGKVTRCDHYRDLKKYNTSITRECMKYQNHVASAIRPEVYEVPFIGKHAYVVQLKQAKEKRRLLEEEISRGTGEVKKLQERLAFLETEADVEVKYRLEVLGKLEQVRLAEEKCRENIATLEKNANFIQKQVQLQALESMRRELEGKIGACNQRIGSIEQQINAVRQKNAGLLEEQKRREQETAELARQAGEDLIVWKGEYERLTQKLGYRQFYDNYSKRKKALETSTKGAEDNMKNAMMEYKTAHDFGASATMEGYPEFALVYERLVTSELLKYEEKVLGARRAAEEEFREQFLSKLQENMKQAQGEFKELNRALGDIPFSTERYEFLYQPSKDYKEYYNMIMDDFNAMQGQSIFSGIFHETHKAVIDELFAKLALDGENQAKVLEEFTDYRTYMDYDIRILHGDGNYSLYSKVCEEKSGGETQTPFYVTVAASFVQLYGNNIGGEAAGLVLLDEAFNNMDDERIGGVLEFFRRLPLQVVIAAPPDKIQYIAPKTQKILLVMTDGSRSFVEDFSNESL